MWSRFQQWIVAKWLSNSKIEIITKDNGYTNIQIKHPKYGILVVHPTEEKKESDAESGFIPFIGYVSNNRINEDG